MDHRTLQSFLALADALHFGRAASVCHMSPSTLSRMISQLEEQLGVTLFRRDNRSVTLTGDGEKFRDYANEALALWAAFQERLIDEQQELSGALTLYGSVTASYSFLYELLTELRERHPGIRVTLQTGDPEQAINRVQSGDADVSIGARPATLPAGLAFRQIATTPLVFIASRDDARIRALSKRRTAPEDWRDTPVILPERGVARDHVLRWFRQQQVAPPIASQVAGNEAIVSMVSLGAGVGVVPRIVLDNSPLAGRVVVLPIRGDFEPLQVGLFALRARLSNRLVDALWTIA